MFEKYESLTLFYALRILSEFFIYFWQYIYIIHIYFRIKNIFECIRKTEYVYSFDHIRSVCMCSP
jgi:hypothetical protein